MSAPHDGSTDPQDHWKGAGAKGWIAAQAPIDRAFRPLEEALVEGVATSSARRVLDVGCGPGATTIAIARRLGSGGTCTGVDVSEMMITAARERADREGVAARFLVADAQTHAFEAGSVDRIVSRFGVMFFSDPVRAFANLRSASASAGRLHCITWRGPEENPFVTTAERAAEPLLPGVSKRVPNEPGPFGLADPDLVRRILSESGWRDVELAPIDPTCGFAASALEAFVSNIGPVGRALQGADEETRAKVLAAVRPAFEPYLQGAEIRFTAACWSLSAHNRA